ncbi:hypothetical protein ACFWG7_31035 [Streptomyces koyangensis]|uniref:DUF4878 domain-containing protein n=1 Tax=Streptomyces koyangensis TaxID=188770 RepID=A0A385DLB5_9ACTN|nr:MULTISPECIES: hypothetical protein [Streptomyces]AXQ58750.1 hypothetical protein D0C37_31850 [Streptomyces koyangensis]PKR41454.1 hypothetical protein CWE27_31085 [Streptomyces sp. EAG2]
MEEVVQKALEFVTSAAGDLAQSVAGQALANLVSDRLANSPDGARALLRLQRDPENELLHRDAAAALQTEAEADPDFARQLQEALAAALAEHASRDGVAGGFSFGSHISGNNAQVAGGHIVSGHYANRDIKTKNIKKFGGMSWPPWVVLGVVLAGMGAGSYVLLQDSDASPSTSRVGADPGEGGVRETWATAQKAISQGDASTYCSLLTPTYEARFQETQNSDCKAAAQNLWDNSESASLAQVGSVTVKDVKIKGPLAEVAAASPEQSEPEYIYLERYGDRWRLTEKLAYATFHPEDCPELNWNTTSSDRDKRCDQASL